MKRLFLILPILTILLSFVGVLIAKAQGIDPCEAHKRIEEVKAYLRLEKTPDFSGYSLHDAVYFGGNGDDLMVATRNVDFDMAFGNVLGGEEQGLPYKLSRYYTAGLGGRAEFVETLTAAGYVQGFMIGPDMWGVYYNIWYKAEGWKDPCSGGGSASSAVPNNVVSYAWYIWVLFILALIAAGIVVLRVIPK